MGKTSECPVPLINAESVMPPDWTKVQNAINKLQNNEQPVNVSVTGWYFSPGSANTFFCANPTLTTFTYSSEWGLGLKLLFTYHDWWASLPYTFETRIILYPNSQEIRASTKYGVAGGDWSHT